jgi:ribulose 1,5-bisphosphate synthetase/thiazole synthase
LRVSWFVTAQEIGGDAVDRVFCRDLHQRCWNDMTDLASEYDLIVIGTGPGGEGAAMQAVKHGKSVAVIEREMAVGGSCTHRGTPSFR